MNAFTIPDDPLSRFREIYAELNQRRGWTQSAMPLRFAAVTLVTTSGPAYALADRFYALADELKDAAGWFGTLTSSARFLIAAVLLRRGDDALSFHDEVERVAELLRNQGMRRGSMYEVMAVLTLRGEDSRRRIEAREIARFQQIYQMMKRHHWWLTGPDDYPACAMLTLREESVGEIARRIENFYEGLRRAGMAAGDPLQLASHVLCLNPAADHIVQGRFLELSAAFRAAGVRMWQSDYDELAVLTFLDEHASILADRVVQHREAMKELRPRPDYNQTFSLACSVVFLEAVRATMGARQVLDVKTMLQVQAILAAQQASAVAASMSANTAAMG